MHPTVSIITPTTESRDEFNERISYFISQQDYPHIVEHLFDYSDIVLGEKRNRLCEQSTGDIILHADSDDMYASDWVTQSVQSLINSKAKAIGLEDIYFWDGTYMRKYTRVKEDNGRRTQKLVAGATLCYWRKTWQEYRFKTLKSGEDTDFCGRIGNIASHGYITGFCATLHGMNTSSHLNLHTKEFSFVNEHEANIILSKF